MAELVSCQTETKLCSVCGRGVNQTTYCTLVTQAHGSFNYIQNSQEERSGGPHIS
jgi:hypothetical protein